MKLFTKNVLETALNEEMTEYLGHEKNRAEAGRGSANVRNGSRAKTVISDAAGEVCIDVPRDREGTFEPRIVKKRQCRLTDVDEIVLSLYAKGWSTPSPSPSVTADRPLKPTNRIRRKHRSCSDPGEPDDRNGAPSHSAPDRPRRWQRFGRR
jgi:hypothetical protein